MITLAVFSFDNSYHSLVEVLKFRCTLDIRFLSRHGWYLKGFVRSSHSILITPRLLFKRLCVAQTFNNSNHTSVDIWSYVWPRHLIILIMPLLIFERLCVAQTCNNSYPAPVDIWSYVWPRHLIILITPLLIFERLCVAQTFNNSYHSPVDIWRLCVAQAFNNSNHTSVHIWKAMCGPDI